MKLHVNVNPTEEKRSDGSLMWPHCEVVKKNDDGRWEINTVDFYAEEKFDGKVVSRTPIIGEYKRRLYPREAWEVSEFPTTVHSPIKVDTWYRAIGSTGLVYNWLRFFRIVEA